MKRRSPLRVHSAYLGPVVGLESTGNHVIFRGSPRQPCHFSSCVTPLSSILMMCAHCQTAVSPAPPVMLRLKPESIKQKGMWHTQHRHSPLGLIVWCWSDESKKNTGMILNEPLYIAHIKRVADVSRPTQEQTTRVHKPKLKGDLSVRRADSGKWRDVLLYDESELVSQRFAPTVDNTPRPTARLATALLWAPNIFNWRLSKTTKPSMAQESDLHRTREIVCVC